MLKKLLMGFSLITVSAFAAQTAREEVAQQTVEAVDYLSVLKEKVTPESTVFLFDINDVLVKKNIPLIIKRSLWTLIRGGWWHVMWPSFWAKVKTLNSQHGSKEAIFIELQRENASLAGWKNDYLELSTAHKPNLPMLDIVRNLKDQGYKLYIFSNMGCETVARMCEKFPDIFDLFDGKVLPNPENNYDCKPRPSFYIELNNYLASQGQGDKQRIFSDDREENIAEAYRNGIAGIVYTSIDAFRSKLVELGVIEDNQ